MAITYYLITSQFGLVWVWAFGSVGLGDPFAVKLGEVREAVLDIIMQFAFTPHTSCRA